MKGSVLCLKKMNVVNMIGHYNHYLPPHEQMYHHDCTVHRTCYWIHKNGALVLVSVSDFGLNYFKYKDPSCL